MTSNITIRSGVDINSEEFQNYYNYLKGLNKTFYYLDLAVSTTSKVLTEPIIFEEKDYDEYKVDDISFIIDGDTIIGHAVYSLIKIKPTIDFGVHEGNSLDMERVKRLSGRICFNKSEFFCKYNIDINDILFQYLSNRIHGSLEYKGTIDIENKIHIKK